MSMNSIVLFALLTNHQAIQNEKLIKNKAGTYQFLEGSSLRKGALLY